MYCAGWIKRGPVGIIDATLRDAMETFRIVKHHLDNEMLPERKTSRDEIFKDLLQENNSVVTMDKWAKIRDYEIAEGGKQGKLKEKVLSKSGMLNLAN